MATRLALVLIVCLCVPLIADDAKPAPLSDLEAVKVKALNTEIALVNALYREANAAKEKADHAAADAQEHMASLTHALEASRPGWTVDLETGKWTKKEPPAATGGK